MHLAPLTREDLERVHALVRRSEVASGTPIATPLEEIADLFANPHFDPAEDARLVELDGELAGWSCLYHSPSGVGQERAFALGHVDPAARGRGVGTRLLAWATVRATARLRGYGNGLPLYLRVDAYTWQEDAQALFAAAGFAPVRWHEELARDLTEGAIRDVDGVRIIPYERRFDEECRRVSNAAFADHWGSTPRGAEAWAHGLGETGTRLDLSFLAIADDAVVGFTVNGHYPGDTEVTGRVDGWIGSLGVLREYRQRGIASALIERSCAAFAAARFSHAMLGVDTDNPTGAARLYRALGFETLHTAVTYEREL